MKTLKYLMIGAMMLGISGTAMAQDNKTAINEIAKVIKANPKGCEKDVKALEKQYKTKKNPEILVGIGQAYYDVKDTANARKYVEQALAASKNSYAPAFLLLGDIAQMANDGGEAAKNYEVAINFDPKLAEAYYRYASVYRKVSPDGATAKLEELRQNCPDEPVDGYIGHIFYISNEFDKAINSFNKAGIAKLDDSYTTELAMCYYFTAKYAETFDVCKKGLQKDPRRAAYNRLALYSGTELQKYDEALAYADALFNKSDSAKITYMDYVYQGNALLGLKKSDEAIDCYKKALDQEIDNKGKRAGVIKNISDAYKDKGEWADADKYYKEFLDAMPTISVNDLVGQASLYQAAAAACQGDDMVEWLKKADAVYAAMVEKFADSEEYATFMRARLAMQLDPESKEGLAKPFCEKLVELIEPELANLSKAGKARITMSYHYLASYYLIVADNKEQADIYWNKLLAVDPENEIAKKALGITEVE